MENLGQTIHNASLPSGKNARMKLTLCPDIPAELLVRKFVALFTDTNSGGKISFYSVFYFIIERRGNWPVIPCGILQSCYSSTCLPKMFEVQEVQKFEKL
jgi:hypothetical protein